MRNSAALGAMLLALFAFGCAVTPKGDVAAFADNTDAHSFELFERTVSRNAFVLPVVQDRQSARQSCGAHVLASVINYWRGADGVRGETLFREHPPASDAGYSMTELMALARANGLVASAVILDRDAIARELESGRPVLAPVRLPSIFVQERTVEGDDVPLFGFVRNSIVDRTASVSEFTNLAMVDHYLLIVGHEGDRWVVVEPVAGYRTISAERLDRYRAPFGNAAMVFSGAPQARRR